MTSPSERESQTQPLFPCYNQEIGKVPQWWGLALWLLVGAVMVAWAWVKLPTFWGDSPRWLLECWRTSLGELPYRDFTLQYPPLGVWVVAAAFLLFGSTFTTAQAVIGLLAIGNLLLTWRLARKVLPEWLSLVVPFVILTKCGTALSPINIFGLAVYTPSVPLNCFFLLLFFLGLVGYLFEGALSPKRLSLMVIGSTGVCLSKPEGVIAIILSLVFVCLADRRMAFQDRPFKDWLRFYLSLALWIFLPAFLIYVAFGFMTGFGPMVEGILGYGQANIPCPLWPTGRGLLVLASELSLGAGITALGASFLSRKAPHQSGRLALLGIVLLAVWLIQFIPDLQATGIKETLRNVLRGLSYAPLSTATKWLSVFLAPYVFALVIKGRRDATTPCTVAVGILLIAMLSIHLRYLFASLTTPDPEDAPLASPLFAILNGYFLVYGLTFFQKWLTNAGSLEEKQVRASVNLSIALILIFFVYSMTNMIRKAWSCQFVRIDTLAGVVLVAREGTQIEGIGQGELSAALYRYVMEHTQPDDYILDIDYGGAVNFAARRRSPIHTTQFLMLKPSKRVLEEDRRRIAEHPPVLITTREPEIKGVYGVNRPVACPCPRFVWRPTEMGDVPGFKFPVLEYIKENYTQAETLAPANEDDAAYIYRKK